MAIKVSYQGQPGSYSEQACQKFFAQPNHHETEIDYLPCTTFREMFAALNKGLVERAVVPIENSLAGSIHENLDLLLSHPRLHIVGELDFRVSHCLLAPKNVNFADITTVRSHPMALSQCSRYLRSNNLTPEVAFDTAGAAKMLCPSNSVGVAAIASRAAADLYDLQILAREIEDEERNFTRFLILSRSKVDYNPLAPGKTSLVFSLMNGPGKLYSALSVFNVSDIDLTKIESRHIHTVREALRERVVEFNEESVEKRWGYVFYVDVAGHTDDPTVASALAQLQHITTFFRILGTYPRH